MNEKAIKKLSKEEIEGLRIVFEETKARAKKEGAQFELTFNDLCNSWIESGGVCSLSGIPLRLPTKDDPSKGTVYMSYIKKPNIPPDVEEVDSEMSDETIPHMAEHVQSMIEEFRQDQPGYVDNGFMSICKECQAREFNEIVGWLKSHLSRFRAE